MNQADIGIIGGSGVYDMPGFEDRKEIRLETPFGSPSDPYMLGLLDGKRVAFLSRHGRGHRLLPSEINYRANIHGFKQLGVTRILSASAVGSLKLEHKPMDFVLPNQFIDWTRSRVSTFFGNGAVAHIGFGHPVCPQLAGYVIEASRTMDFPVKRGGTYICMEEPAFSTRAESELYRSWGLDLIGMTAAQEVKLSREAEICYQTIAMVTDYDCWHEDQGPVTADMIVGYLVRNSQNAQRLIKATLSQLPEKFDCSCQHALENALLSDPAAIPAETKERLELIIGKYVR